LAGLIGEGTMIDCLGDSPTTVEASSAGGIWSSEEVRETIIEFRDCLAKEDCVMSSLGD
jgi:hypothetical protein